MLLSIYVSSQAWTLPGSGLASRVSDEKPAEPRFIRFPWAEAHAMDEIKSGPTGADLTDRWDREIYGVCVALPWGLEVAGVLRCLYKRGLES